MIILILERKNLFNNNYNWCNNNIVILLFLHVRIEYVEFNHYTSVKIKEFTHI